METIEEKARTRFLRAMARVKNHMYPYMPRHVAEVERWALYLLEKNPKADRTIVLTSVWLHDIGWKFNRTDIDHAILSEKEARKFLHTTGVSENVIESVAHCVRAHRCRDIQPQTIEAKIVAAADSATHFTDINYIIHLSDGIKEYARGKLRRDYKDVGLFPELQKELTPVYEAWKKLIEAYPELPKRGDRTELTPYKFWRIVEDIMTEGDELCSRLMPGETRKLGYVAIFSKSETEETALFEVAGTLGTLIHETPTGKVYRMSGKAARVSFVKVRYYNPQKPQRGAPDYLVPDYEAFKKKYHNDTHFTLIKRPAYELLKLSDEQGGAVAYFPSAPLEIVLGIKEG